MIDLFLDNKRVVVALDSNIKFCRENPNISSSGDYTFDVNLPLSIADNRIFFGPWHRIEANKNVKTYDARLYADNFCILNGSAKITGITNDVVKVQLYGDRSEFNAVHGSKYIDELNLPYFVRNSNGSFGGSSNTRTDVPNMPEERWDTYIYTPIFNESADKVVNVMTAASMLNKSVVPYFAREKQHEAQFNLLFVIKSIFKSIGYKIDVSSYDVAPFNHIYIASCISSKQMIHALPHWTLKEFVTEVERFFGCNFVFSSSELSVTMKQQYDGEITDIKKLSAFSTVDEFSIEVSESSDIESINYSDLHYDLSNSSFHDIDYIDDVKADNLPVRNYPSYDELLKAYEKMSVADKGKYLLRCPQGDYCTLVYNSPSSPQDKKSGLYHVNQFGDLKKNDDAGDNVMDIKICPVAIADAIPVQLYAEFSGSHNHGCDIRPVKDKFCYQTMPSMVGKEDMQPKGHFMGGKQREENIEVETTEIQDMLTEDVTNSKYEKPNRMEVFLWDESYQHANEFEYSGKIVDVHVPAAFTAYDLKNLRGVAHQPWSLSLKQEQPSVKNMQKVHNKLKINQTQKFCIRFINDTIPSAADIFMFSNRKFIAESIEISLTDGKMDRLMTGYFYEIN